MTISRKLYVSVLVAALALPVTAILAFNLIVDPLLLFHLDWDQPQVYYSDDTGYYSNVGIARRLGHDLAVFGESTSRDVVASDLSATFGLPALKFAFSGGSYGLLKETFEFVHNLGGLEYAIFDIIPEDLDSRFDRPHPDWKHVAALYDDVRMNDVLYYASTDIAKLSIEKIAAKRNRPDNLCPRYRDFIYELDQLNMHLKFNKCEDSLVMKGGDLAGHRNYWQKHWAPLERWDTELHRRTAAALLAKATADTDPRSAQWIERTRRNIREFRKLVESHEDITFVFFFPPRPAYRYTARMLDDPAEFVSMLRGIGDMVDAIAPLPNARVFGFGDREFTLDWTNYLEGSHYRPEITRIILREIAAGRGRLTPENVDEYLEGFIAAIGNTEIPAAIYQEANGSQ